MQALQNSSISGRKVRHHFRTNSTSQEKLVLFNDCKFSHASGITEAKLMAKENILKLIENTPIKNDEGFTEFNTNKLVNLYNLLSLINMAGRSSNLTNIRAQNFLNYAFLLKQVKEKLDILEDHKANEIVASLLILCTHRHETWDRENSNTASVSDIKYKIKKELNIPTHFWRPLSSAFLFEKHGIFENELVNDFFKSKNIGSKQNLIGHFIHNEHIFKTYKNLANNILIYNHEFPSSNKVTQKEILFLSEYLEKFKHGEVKLEKNLPILLKKIDTKMRHSYLFYKNDDGMICIIIKPNIHNLAFNNVSLKIGVNKIIKRTGIEIKLDSLLRVYSCESIVTTSACFINDFFVKGNEFADISDPFLLNECFKKITFSNSNNDVVDRIIYTKKDLGDNLDNFIRNKYLTYQEKVNIANQLTKTMKLGSKGTYDIKLKNVVYNKKVAQFIDDKDPSFTYTTKYADRGGIYDGNSEKNKTPVTEEEIIQQQIFGLTIIIYQMLNKKEVSPFFSFKYDETPQKIEFSLKNYNYKFSKELTLAFEGKLSFPQLQESVGRL